MLIHTGDNITAHSIQTRKCDKSVDPPSMRDTETICTVVGRVWERDYFPLFA